MDFLVEMQFQRIAKPEIVKQIEQYRRTADRVSTTISTTSIVYMLLITDSLQKFTQFCSYQRVNYKPADYRKERTEVLAKPGEGI